MSASASLSNPRSEKAVLGALLRSPIEFWKISESLRADHFSDALHRQIFTAIHDINMGGQKLSLTLVASRLPEEDEGKLVSSYLAVLLKNAEEIEQALDFTDNIIEAWGRRRLKAIAAEIEKLALDPMQPIADTIAAAETSIMDVSRGSEARAEQSLKTVLSSVSDRASDAFKDEYVPGFDTGLSSVDQMLGRVMPGDLGIIGGGVGESKTALAIQMAMRMSKLAPTGVFELEMQNADLGRRILAGETNLSVSTIEEGTFDFAGFDSIQAARRNLEDRQLYFIDEPALRISQIRARCMAMKRSRGLKVAFIDSLKRVIPDGKVRDFVERTEAVTGGLKNLAKELEIAVIVLAHRTRGSQDRDDPMPRTSDFYGGGSIEENADWILGVWRRYLWLVQRRPPKAQQGQMDAWVRDLEACRDKIEVVCLKRRRGESMEKAAFHWNGQATRFEEIQK